MVTDNVVKLFLNKLPLKNEEEEAQKSHNLFLRQVMNNNPYLVNDNTKTEVMAALVNLKNELNNNENELTILNEEGVNILN